jgi:vacuolar-type H+-ATPase subunit H
MLFFNFITFILAFSTFIFLYCKVYAILYLEKINLGGSPAMSIELKNNTIDNNQDAENEAKEVKDTLNDTVLEHDESEKPEKESVETSTSLDSEVQKQEDEIQQLLKTKRKLEAKVRNLRRKVEDTEEDSNESEKKEMSKEKVLNTKPLKDISTPASSLPISQEIEAHLSNMTFDFIEPSTAQRNTANIDFIHTSLSNAEGSFTQESLSLEEAREKAELIIVEAREEAHNITSQANFKLELTKKQCEQIIRRTEEKRAKIIKSLKEESEAALQSMHNTTLEFLELYKKIPDIK